MNSAEQKIREAFDKWLKSNGTPEEYMYKFIGELDPFTAGYMALLNELEPSSFPSTRGMLYLLPEGIEKL